MLTALIPSWALIGFAAVFFWVAGSFFDKYLLVRYFGDEDNDDAGPGALIIFSSYFGFLVIILLLFFGFEKISFDLLSGIFGMFVGVINGTWILLYLYALNRTEVSRVVPMLQTIPIFGLIFSFFLLGEVLTFEQMVAAAGIIIGALVLLYDKTESFLKIDLKTLGLMLGASSCVALSETYFKFFALDSNYWTVAFWTYVGFALFGVLLYMFVEKYRVEFEHMISERIKSVLTSNSTNEILDNIAELVFFAAIIVGPVVLVQSLNAYQPILILGASIFMARFWPQYFADELQKTTFLQKLLGILVITIASVYLYFHI